MALGFTLGLVAAFLWSLTNIIDKYLTSKYAPDGNVMGILLLSCFFPAVLLPIALHYGAITTTPTIMWPLMLSGGLMVAWIYFYLQALTHDDTSIVMTILVITPVFTLIFSNLLLGEWLTLVQFIGSGLIIIGALIVSLDFATKKIRLPLLFNALGAAVVMALMLTLFKFGTPETGDIWQSVFWRAVGMVGTGLGIITFMHGAMDDFLNFIREHTKAGLGFNSINELLTLTGDTIFGIAILFAPIALIQMTESYQPIFILLITFILLRLGITSIPESFTTAALTRKFAGVLFVIAGSAFVL